MALRPLISPLAHLPATLMTPSPEPSALYPPSASKAESITSSQRQPIALTLRPVARRFTIPEELEDAVREPVTVEVSVEWEGLDEKLEDRHGY